MSTVPTIVLGGTGYVAGELLRLIAGHPNYKLAGILSDSQPGEPVAKAFSHLASAYPDTKFASIEEIEKLVTTLPVSAIFSAAPHGASAALIDKLLAASEKAGTKPRVVDISADYRYSTADAYAAVYKHPHGAPQRIAQFTCAVPEHLATSPTSHVAHPGCFATAILLASVPLLKLGIATPQLFVSGVTGSTGSGRKPVEGTHHPLRHGDLYAYNALTHRHAPEVAACALAATGVDLHADPFANPELVDVRPECCDGPHILVPGRKVLVEGQAALNARRRTGMDDFKVGRADRNRVDPDQNLGAGGNGYRLLAQS